MALGRWRWLNLGVVATLVGLPGCTSGGDPMSGGGTGGETDGAEGPGDPGDPVGPGEGESTGEPGATTGADETSGGGGGESSGGPVAGCEEDEECEAGSACISGRCCYAVAYDGSCCESGYCGDPNDCEVFGCGLDEVCTDHRCEELEPLQACEEPNVSSISLPIPGLAEATVIVFAESDGTQGAELVALEGSTVTVADAVPSGIPVLTTVAVPGKAALVGAVAQDLDADGLDEFIVVDAEGTVTLLHALGDSGYEAVQAIGAGLEPPLVVANLDGSGPGLLGLSDQGYSAHAIDGLTLDAIGDAPPEGITGGSFLSAGMLLSSRDVAVHDGAGVAIVSSPDAAVLRVDSEGGQPAIADADGDGLTDLAIVASDEDLTRIKVWSQEAIATEGAEPQREVLTFGTQALAWGDIDGDGVSALLAATATDVTLVHLGDGACHQVLASEPTDLLAAGDLDGDGVDEVVLRGDSGLVLLDASN